MKRLVLFGLCCSAGYLWASGPWYRSASTGQSGAWEDASNWESQLTDSGNSSWANSLPDGGYWIDAPAASDESQEIQEPPTLTLGDVSIGDLRVTSNGNLTLKGGRLASSA